MIAAGALPWRAGLVGAGAAAALAGPSAVLVYGAAAVLIGLPHGAGDVLLVHPRERGRFVFAYLLAVALVLLAWRGSPSVTLAGFLLLSVVHFALDAAPGERLAGALLPVAGPALLHESALRAIFAAIGATPDCAALLAQVLFILSIVALAATVVALAQADVATHDRRLRLIWGAGAALLLPPVAGFAAAFVILHAGPTGGRRARAAGGHAAFLLAVAPTMAGAAALALATAWWFGDRPAPGLVTLFGLISALAAPHMLVTPWWIGHEKGARNHVRAPLHFREAEA